MRILLLGKNGQVGWELQRTLAPLGELIAMGRAEADLSQPDELRSIVRQLRPQVIVNAAAYTDVDRAESEAQLAIVVNTTAPGVLAEEAEALGAILIHYSTDYVFDGEKRAPYVEEDVPNPISTYGRSKLEGESLIRSIGGAHLILRTSWVYGLRRDNFVTKVLRWAREKEVLRIAQDQTGSPTWARLLAEITGQALSTGLANIYDWGRAHEGVYHVAGSGAVSRLAWAEAILHFDPRREEFVAKSVQGTRSEEFPMPARRPAFSALDCAKFRKAFSLTLPEWQEALSLALER